MDYQALILGIALILIGAYIIAKTSAIPLDELIRAVIWHPRTMEGAGLRWLGLGLCVVGLVAVLAGLGLF
jgi:hypothetical protein